jgi:hypothetical protein
VIDPGCYSDLKFPDSADKKKVQDFAGRIMKFFAHTPYILPGGADIGADRTKCFDRSYDPCKYGRGNLVMVYLTGEAVINAYGDQSKKEPLHVNSMLALTQYGDYWVARTILADDASKEEFKKIKVQFKDAP